MLFLKECYFYYKYAFASDYGVSVQNLNDINHGPKFVIEPNNTVILGKKPHTFLDCVVIANPQAVYTWRRGTNFNEVITTQTDVRYTLTNGRLTISAPNDQKDTGTYQCTAKNKYGTVLSQVVSLSFQGKISLSFV